MRFNDATITIPGKVQIDTGAEGLIHIIATIRRVLDEDDLEQLPAGLFDPVSRASATAWDAADTGAPFAKEAHSVDCQLSPTTYTIRPPEGAGVASILAEASGFKVTITKGRALVEWKIAAWVTPADVEVIARCTGKDKAALMDVGPVEVSDE